MKTNRKHGRVDRFFVRCECGATAQASDVYGYLHIIHINEPSVVKTYRIPKSYADKISDLRIDVRLLVMREIDRNTVPSIS